MAKNSDHYYKCKVGDEVRMFRDTSAEALGIYVRLRNFSFDSDPIGFLVDHYHRPYDLRRLADATGEKNARFQALWAEVRQQRLIQSVVEYDLYLERLAHRKRAARKHGIFRALISDVWPAAPMVLDEIFLIPQILDQRLETLYGERTGKDGGNPELVKDADEVDNQANAFVVNQGGYPPSLTRVVNPQRSQSEVIGHRSEKKEKETAATAARAELSPQGPAPWSWKKHLYECDQVRKWEATLDETVKLDDLRYETQFFGRFHYAYDVFRAAVAFYEFGPRSPEIPQSCHDGHHVPDDGTSRCRYCREFVGRATA